MKLSMAAQMLDTDVIGNDVTISGVSTDSRQLGGGELFVALRGPHFDGHEYVDQAESRGAAAAMVSRQVITPLPNIRVADTERGLGRLAASWRAGFDIPVIGITGSNGKTSVKEMVAAILAQRGNGLVTIGNLNNSIGLPLTLLRLRAEHDYAVVEMGMNHLGEIAYLSGLARPGIVVITNAAEAHLEGVGGIDAVAQAKAEIFDGLMAQGIAVINADDAYAEYWRGLAAPHKVISFGLHQDADYSAEFVCGAQGSDIFISTPKGGVAMRLPVLGKHNVSNAVAATAVAMQAGADLNDVKVGLEGLHAVSGRLEVKSGLQGSRILDDTYNANPASVAAGLDVLRQSDGETVLVLGDMLELGKSAKAIHGRVGELARRLGVNRLFAVGTLARAAKESFGGAAKHYKSHKALVKGLQEILHPDMTLLIKGSRGSHMEEVVNGISEPLAKVASEKRGAKGHN
ncbi:MAG: UDP-N-acetylmuramoyl-tripeptide--D-alanyl-D-alanine ligase [Gammaproteobacteria bacterium]|nr:UDP-N-acetylmuramoyl-tripeptide--D-alanyl-D-alanine ligase [Gammaproteobacteria bacterium]